MIPRDLFGHCGLRSIALGLKVVDEEKRAQIWARGLWGYKYFSEKNEFQGVS